MSSHLQTNLTWREYKDDTSSVYLNGIHVPLKRCIKHLGIIVDENLRYDAHIQVAADKARKMMTALGRLMLNLGGPKEPRRRLLVGVLQYVLLYGAPVWGPSLEYSKGHVDRL